VGLPLGKVRNVFNQSALARPSSSISVQLSAYVLFSCVCPTGNTALTRRASKYSTLRAIVLRFSQSRKRYKQQGILVEIAALQQAESDCLADAELRDRRREREAICRNQQDAAYIVEFTCHICSRYPACPADQSAVIADHACQKYSGRVGRSAAAKDFAPEAIDLVIAHIRHVHTRYDELLASGWERYAAREAIAVEVQEVLKKWSDFTPDSEG
jgi:hypothetical protein